MKYGSNGFSKSTQNTPIHHLQKLPWPSEGFVFSAWNKSLPKATSLLKAWSNLQKAPWPSEGFMLTEQSFPRATSLLGAEISHLQKAPWPSEGFVFSAWNKSLPKATSLLKAIIFYLKNSLLRYGDKLLIPFLIFAEREGFEPSVPVKVQHLSRVPLSTTQAPLRLHKKNKAH